MIRLQKAICKKLQKELEELLLEVILQQSYRLDLMSKSLKMPPCISQS